MTFIDKQLCYNSLKGGIIILNEYEVNINTCLISYDGTNSEIIEGDKTYYVSASPTTIISYNCEYYGSSLLGRLVGSKNMLKMGYKLPIIVEESKELIFMPTSSFEHKDCAWINIANIKDYQAKDNNVIVNFFGGQQRELPISFFSFESQFFRASKLLLTLKMRKKG